MCGFIIYASVLAWRQSWRLKWLVLFEAGFEESPFDFDDALGLGKLPFFHGDLFNRMLISQAIARGLTLLTNDEIFKKYNVPLLLNQ